MSLIYQTGSRTAVIAQAVDISVFVSLHPIFNKGELYRKHYIQKDIPVLGPSGTHLAYDVG